MASEATPRINSRYLEQFLHQTVRVVGKVTSLQGETATLDAEGTVNIHLNRVRLDSTSGPFVHELEHRLTSDLFC